MDNKDTLSVHDGLPTDRESLERIVAELAEKNKPTGEDLVEAVTAEPPEAMNPSNPDLKLTIPPLFSENSGTNDQAVSLNNNGLFVKFGDRLKNMFRGWGQKQAVTQEAEIKPKKVTAEQRDEYRIRMREARTIQVSKALVNYLESTGLTPEAIQQRIAAIQSEGNRDKKAQIFALYDSQILSLEEVVDELNKLGEDKTPTE